MIRILIIITFVLLSSTGCRKDKDVFPDYNQEEIENNILSDLIYKVMIPNYEELSVRADSLHSYATLFHLSNSQQNLEQLKTGWKSLRESWEKSKALHLGPIEDFNFISEMDTWPISIDEMNSILASTISLDLSFIQTLPISIRGFHTIEYVVFGNDGNKTASQITVREREFLVPLSLNLLNLSISLKVSLLNSNFINEWLFAGKGSIRYPEKENAFLPFVNSLAGICEEVAGKMYEPIITRDSTLLSSYYSRNTTTDFIYSFIGLSNSYFGKYHEDGQGLNDLVRIRNISLEQKIQSQIDDVIANFSIINLNYGQAIITQQFQINILLEKIETLKTTLEDELFTSLPVWIN